MTRRSVIGAGHWASYYFRTSADDGDRKALVQIDERCNLH
jgi:hypothetical protein